MLLFHLSTKQTFSALHFLLDSVIFLEIGNALRQVSWLLSILLDFKRLGQEVCQEFKASFGYIVTSKLQNETVTKTKKKRGGGEEEGAGAGRVRGG